MHSRVSVRVSSGIKFCGLPAYDYQTRHPNEVGRTTSGEDYTANIVLSSMHNSLGNQTNWNETIRRDQEEIRDRLVAVEAAIDVTAKEGEKSTAEAKRIGRRRRS